jgi:coenzyme F420-reducing hydrogenase delta subunit
MVERNATIHLFYCSNSMTENELQSLQTRLGADGLRMLSLPCSGKMTIPYLLKAFEKGADGVVLCSCPQTECKQLEGNLRASKRAEAVDELIDEIGLGKSRVVMITKKQGQIEKVIDSIQSLQKGLCMAHTPSDAGSQSRDIAIGVPAKVSRVVVAGSRSGNRRENAA